MKTGLALEGGGARGAYQVGVVRAYLESGYDFDGFVGTSIGAFNSAVLAQGDFEKLYGLWSEISQEMLFDTSAQTLLDIGETRLGRDFLVNLNKSLRNFVGEKGIDTSKMRATMGRILDEEKLRATGRDFGLVTVSVSERKPCELYLQDIPEGGLLSYIMASASFPGFRPEVIDGQPYLDGGLYNNCPINMLLRKEYDKIIAVRTHVPGIFLPIPKNNADITIISANRNLGNMMHFSGEAGRALLIMGYFDGLRALQNLKGKIYYVKPEWDIDFATAFASLDDASVLRIGRTLGLATMPPKRMLFEKILPRLGKAMKLPGDFDYADLFIALMEDSAQRQGIEPYQIYSAGELYARITPGAGADQSEQQENHQLGLKLPANPHTLAGRMLANALLELNLAR